MILRRCLTLQLVLLCGACSRTADAPPAPPSALVRVQAAATGHLDEILEAYGTVEFTPDGAVTLPVLSESRVTEVLVSSGDGVRRGQALLRLAPSATASLDLEKARRDAEVAAADRDRIRRLREAGLATESDLLAATNAAATAAALRDSLAQRAGQGRAWTVVAPRAGIVDALSARPGDILPAGAMAARIVSPDSLQARVGIEPEDFARVRVGQPVRISALQPGAPTVTSRIAALDRRLDPGTRLAALLIPLPKGGALLPGAALRAQIIVSTRDGAVIVPRSALVYGADDTVVVYLARDGHAQRHPVTLGLQYNDAVEIVSGVQAGDSVIIEGNTVLEDGMSIRTQDGTGGEGPHP